ncbi:MAG: hypothetical protein KDE27_07560 [Planctomycetes bacterium]|nr:hypothetical protein [Planctomycetota bacterium]
MSLQSYLATTVAAVVFATAPVGPRLGGSISVNPDPLQEGGAASVSYSDPSRAGQTIEIEVDNGSRRNFEKQTIIIVLDENGEGSTPWVVPGWPVAKFNGPDAPEVSRPVVAN